jgi:photosystem II stability/assembly factor-like uncharacterized protein
MSRDGGDAWRALDAVAPGTLAATLAINPRDPATIYVGTVSEANGFVGAGVFKSLDGGDSWRPVNAGLTDARVSAVALDPRSPGTAYAAVDGRGVFKRVDGRWRAASTGLIPESAYAVAVDPQHPATVYTGSYGGVFKSTNGGGSWRASLTEPFQRGTGSWPSTRVVAALAVDPQKPTTVYALTGDNAWHYNRGLARVYESRLYKSTDGGVTWRISADVQALDVAAARGEVLAQVVHKSPLVIDPLQADTLYVGGFGVRRSVDGGTTRRIAGLTRTAVLALAVDPKKPATLYAGTHAGLFTSRDAGASWQALEGPLDGVRVEAVAIDPQRRGNVYAGTDSGVFWTADGGHSWRRFTRLPRRTFDALAVDSTAGIVYAGSYGGGMFELKLSP